MATNEATVTIELVYGPGLQAVIECAELIEDIDDLIPDWQENEWLPMREKLVNAFKMAASESRSVPGSSLTEPRDKIVQEALQDPIVQSSMSWLPRTGMYYVEALELAIVAMVARHKRVTAEIAKGAKQATEH